MLVELRAGVLTAGSAEYVCGFLRKPRRFFSSRYEADDLHRRFLKTSGRLSAKLVTGLNPLFIAVTQRLAYKKGRC